MTRSTTKCSRLQKSTIAAITLLGILKSTIKVLFIISTILGIAVALFTWIVLKPIIRAIG